MIVDSNSERMDCRNSHVDLINERKIDGLFSPNNVHRSNMRGKLSFGHASSICPYSCETSAF